VSLAARSDIATSSSPAPRSTPLVAVGPTVDIFAGPGGWDEGARAIGIPDVIGYEWDRDACATAEAAGHKRVQADVSMVDLSEMGPVDGLIGSPPCQSYSSAGKQKGKLDRPRIERHVQRIRDAGRWLHYAREGWHDDRSPLVLEPLRWALALQPRWIALEQVPAVLPLWDAMGNVLEDHGWDVATGVLSSEQFGVAQTRKRAFLVARRGGLASLPAPTHRKYRKGVTQAEGDPSLFPWVSMAEALGLGPGLVGFPWRAETASNRAGADTVTIDGTEYRARDLRSTGEPAMALTEKVRSWQYRGTPMANTTVRNMDEPAPTVLAAHEPPKWVGVRFGNQEHSAVRGADEPAATIRYSERMSACSWLFGRPSTTVCGDGPETRAVRVSVQEAAVLQSYRPDYPWQGSRTAQYRQIGDSVPPLLGAAVLRAAWA
jgi:DNA (cytosine-5)-methyltransferase 1